MFQGIIQQSRVAVCEIQFLNYSTIYFIDRTSNVNLQHRFIPVESISIGSKFLINV